MAQEPDALFMTRQLAALRRRADLSLDELARKMGYAAASSIQRYENPSAYAGGFFSRKFVEKLAAAIVGMGKPPIRKEEVWKLAGPEFILSQSSNVRSGPDVEAFERVPLGRLPIRGEVAAGRWLETPPFLDWDGVTDFVDGLSVPESRADYTYGLRVRGTSINRVAREGDVLVCLDASSGIDYADGDLAIIERRRDDGYLREVTAKRLRRRHGKWVLMPESDDPMWQTEIEIDSLEHEDDEIRFVAKVLYVVKLP